MFTSELEIVANIDNKNENEILWDPKVYLQ